MITFFAETKNYLPQIDLLQLADSFGGVIWGNVNQNKILPVTVVVELVETGHGDDRTPSCTHTVEYLHGGLTPDL